MMTKVNGFSLPCRLMPSVGRDAVFAFVVLLLIVFIVYSNSFRGDWHFDDFPTIVENPNIRLQALDWDGLKKSFYGPTYGTDAQRVARPAAYASFALNYFFGGIDVTGYHIVNVLVHVLSAFFLFLLVRLTLTLPPMREEYGSVAYPVALLSSFLWATNPLHVHAVSIIVQRMASMAGLGYVAALYFYARARTAQTVVGRMAGFTLCGGAALAAFATKENTAVLPLAFWLYDLFFLAGISAETWRRALKWSPLPLVFMLGLGLLYTDFSMERAVYESGVRPFSPLERLLTQGRVMFFYVSLLLYPIPSRLTLLHDIEVSRSLFDPWTTAAAIVGAALCVLLAVVRARRYPLLSFAILFFLLNHLVEGTWIPLELIFEHRNYIPSMFFFVPVTLLMVRCLDYFSYRPGLQIFMAVGFALLLAFQGYTTFERNDIVRSDLHLWLDNVQKSPDLSRPRINLAKHYYEAGMYEQAYRELTTAEISARDTNLRQIGLASYGLGIYYLYQMNDLRLAEKKFNETLERIPGYPAAIIGLVRIALKEGKIDQAWRLLEGYSPDRRYNRQMTSTRALVLLKKGDPQGALKSAMKAIALEWDNPEPWQIAGQAWRQLDQMQQSLACWEKSQQLSPANPRTLLALVELYDQLQDKPALTRTAIRCLVVKGDGGLDEWLSRLARDSGDAAYEVNPQMLERTIRRVIRSELAR